MNTYIYMVRHGESPKLEEGERTRGLTENRKYFYQLFLEC